MTETGTQTLDERKVVLYTLVSLDGAVDHPVGTHRVVVRRST
jgi:hypothetical protein